MLHSLPLRPLLAVLLLAVPGMARCAAQEPAEASAERAELLRRINAERRAAGAPALRLDPALSAVAQRHAEEIGRRGSHDIEALPAGRMQQRIQAAGYQADEWTESVSLTSEGPAAAVGDWKRSGRSGFRRAMGEDYRDLGIGVSAVRGVPVYTFLLAVPARAAFERRTAGLADLRAVREALLDRINAERRRAGRRALRLDAKLNAAAQEHAEDLLARGYFDHQSPEGKTVRDRAEDTGYDWRAVGENIAEGQSSVDEVVTAWMRSSGHRRNILHPDYTEMGLGLALGRNRQGYDVLWVQTFGKPR